MKAKAEQVYFYRVKGTDTIIYCPTKHAGNPVDHEYVGEGELPEGQVLSQCEFETEEDA